VVSVALTVCVVDKLRLGAEVSLRIVASRVPLGSVNVLAGVTVGVTDGVVVSEGLTVADGGPWEGLVLVLSVVGAIVSVGTSVGVVVSEGVGVMVSAGVMLSVGDAVGVVVSVGITVGAIVSVGVGVTCAGSTVGVVVSVGATVSVGVVDPELVEGVTSCAYACGISVVNGVKICSKREAMESQEKSCR